ncbi:aminotransferase class I/II-fold pyridoxal phosphate-dependent enzyme [Streptomyces sp. NBC_00859]|uniref:aminotransferase class I/II-fold pyridoxal phosphate-dependent enzyme n=1 Tax=Streptomyces sp. NBC_00859 TaxID=2903682 RepID=UPI00386FC799|nr:pyridoxal phosphate-dependent aminotransferase [Streptomyces sp. NBC_00859]
MQRTVPESRGPVRYGPPAPGPGLPVLPGLAAVLSGAAPHTAAEPPGGGPGLRTAACGYWTRRGLGCEPGDTVAADGPQSLLLALLAADGGDLMLPRPCPAWWIPQARLIGRSAYPVPTPAECGGVPDPYALLETVRRVRTEGGNPRLLLLSVADDPTATTAPPELLHLACEAALSEGLHIISDETWRDTRHRPDETVLLSPAEMCPDEVTVLSDLAGSLTPTAWPVAVARFPGTADGAARRARTLDVLTATGAAPSAPVAAAAAWALREPAAVRERAAQAARLHARLAAAAHEAVLAAGALARPPQAGRHLYVDLGPLGAGLSDLGVTDAMELEEYLGERIGAPAPGGHRFGDDPDELRVRLATGPLVGSTPQERLESLNSTEPLELPHVARALSILTSALEQLR